MNYLALSRFVMLLDEQQKILRLRREGTCFETEDAQKLYWLNKAIGYKLDQIDISDITNVLKSDK